MKRIPSLFSIHLVINPHLWVLFNYVINDSIYIFSFSFWFIIIQMTKVNEEDIMTINNNMESIKNNTPDKKNENINIYAPGKIKVICIDCAEEAIIFRNETWTCPKCNNSDPKRILIYTELIK